MKTTTKNPGQDVVFLRRELKELAKTMRQWERQDTAAIKTCDSDDRGKYAAKAKAYGYFANELYRILSGKSLVEEMKGLLGAVKR